MDMKNPKINTIILDHIYEIVRTIPAGRVCTYGAIAQAVGFKSGARFVGWAMSQSHSLGNVPAHRVVNSQGLLTGKFHFATITQMEELLKAEGVSVKNDKVQNFKTLFWDPIEHINI